MNETTSNTVEIDPQAGVIPQEAIADPVTRKRGRQPGQSRYVTINRGGEEVIVTTASAKTVIDKSNFDLLLQYCRDTQIKFKQLCNQALTDAVAALVATANETLEERNAAREAARAAISNDPEVMLAKLEADRLRLEARIEAQRAKVNGTQTALVDTAVTTAVATGRHKKAA